MGPTDEELAELYRRYAPVLHHRAQGILGTDEAASDAVQETFARVIRHWDRFRGEASPLTWMYRITTNWCLNQLRNQRGRAQKLDVHREELVGAGVSIPRSGQEAELVRRLLTDTDPQTRQIVLHTYFDEMTRQQVAERVGLSVPTVRKRLNTFYDRARHLLETPGALPKALATVALSLAASGELALTAIEKGLS